MVQKGGPADKGGLKAKDVITRFNGKIINTSSDLPRIVCATKPGSDVSVHVWRNGSVKKLMVQVDEFPLDEKDAILENKERKKADVYNRLGLALRELSDNEKKQLGINNGLLVEGIQQGGARRSGMRPNDIILGIDNQDVTTVELFNQVLSKIRKGRNIALLIRRGKTTYFITMKLNVSESK